MNAPEKTVSSEPLILRRREGAVETIVMNRPKQYNSISTAMIDEIKAALDAVAKDEAVRAVVLAGAGKAFCAGHDLKEMMANRSYDFTREIFDRCCAMMMTIQQMPQPVIARVHGMATAAGCQLVAMCDMAVAASDARFAVSGINLGLFCSTPSVALSRNVGRKAAFEMLFTGGFIDAEQALRQGLVNRVAQPQALDDTVEQLVRSVLEKPRIAVAMGKSLFYRQLETDIASAYTDAAQTMACNMMQEDTLEGVQAFIDKRRPDWHR